MNDLIFHNIETVFRKVFGNPKLEIKLTDTAHDIPGWDSLIHMTLINELEIFFNVTFTFDEVTNFKDVSDIVNLVSKKIS